MNKTIIININGIVFHIEEDAYEILKNYMTEVKRHFSGSADSLEITTDIENRIAEMFNEILARDSKQVIIEQDVNEVIAQMGTVADFENADEEAQKAEVPFGAQANATRRLFRDPDDHLVAGVCSGIANYFDFNPVWVRLAFVILIAFGGTGLLIYIILWLVVPKAVTRADRMAMRGEKQNLQGFKKNFEEEMNAMRQNLGNFGQEARPLAYKARDFAGDFFHHLGIFLTGLGKVLVKLVGVLILLTCLGFAVTAVVLLIMFTGFAGNHPANFFPASVIADRTADNIYICAFVVVIIPLISIIMVTLKGIFNVGSVGRSTGTVFLVLWICSVGMLIFYSVRIAENFRTSESITQTIDIKPTKDNTYYLKLNNAEYFSHDDSVRLDIKNHFKNMTVIDDSFNGDHDEPRSVQINIEKSDVTAPELVEEFRANGRDKYEAVLNARNTSYVFAQQDTVLTFDYALRREQGMPWRGQEVSLTLKLPLNAKVIIDQKLDRYVNLDLHGCNADDKRPDYEPAVFTMTDNGLQCKIDTVVTAKPDSAKKAKPDSTQKAQ